MRYLVKINDIKEKIDYFESQLDIIVDNINDIEELKNVIIWEGSAATACINSLDDYVTKLRCFQDEILNCILLLTSFYDRFGSEYTRLKAKYAYNEEEVYNG